MRHLRSFCPWKDTLKAKFSPFCSVKIYGSFPSALGSFDPMPQKKEENYGFLFLHVMSLAIQMAKLAQTGRTGGFLEKMENLTTNDSIRHTLTHYIRTVEDDTTQLRRSFWPLEWRQGPIPGQKVCLKEIGGCTVSDALFLIEQLWESRKEFLYASAWGAAHFPGWSGLLHMLWNISLQARNSGSTSHPAVPVQNLHLVALVDIICRYSLSVRDESAHGEDGLLPFLAEDEKFSLVLSKFNKSTAVDTTDSEAIVQAFSAKIKSLPGPRKTKDLDAYILTLLGFTVNNLDRTSDDLSSQISQITKPLFERLWSEFLPADKKDTRDWGAILGCLSGALTHLLKQNFGYVSNQ
ncbi:hypothetical protein RSOLAG1IB_09452 [Rhizoctonia solani AG-1 IB]|uniref:Uncharacterized protein n=1 Tax=Thanatephorus cucumeris (strain AG1-IB / isolate 7/3/14) TaxID=1108050 RepID=A0A0B7FTL5_THACB|nr:hypothetical protein RSOLAG1IB_09452 [Rhizoctonia solani AG-1 IB]